MMRYIGWLMTLSVMVTIACKNEKMEDSSAWEEYIVHFADAYCDLRSDCDPTLFAEEFDGDAETCKKAVVVNESKAKNKKEDRECAFDAGEADICIETAETLNCQGWLDGELDEACGGVWDCG